jgi:hypothetical protein
MTTDSRMLLQAPADLADNDSFVVRCPAALSVSIAVGAAMTLVSVEEYCKRAVIEKLLSDGLAVEVTPELSAGVHH